METLRVLCVVPTETLRIKHWYIYCSLQLFKSGPYCFFHVLPCLMFTVVFLFDPLRQCISEGRH